MSFLAPAALGLASLALPLIALYMLRSRRERIEVSSLLLWETAADPLSAARPWRRLKITPLLLLQLAVLTAFVISLARPFGAEEARLGAHTVLVMDVSGSMGMVGRFGRAQQEALGWAEEMSGEQLVSVIEAGALPRVVTAFSREREEVVAAISALEVTGGDADLAEAIRLGRGLATPERPSDLVLFTDGGEAPLAAEPVAAARHLPFDETGPNWAIDALSLDRDSAGVIRAFVSVANHGAPARPVTAELEADGKVVSHLELSPAPGETDRATVPVPVGPGSVVVARLVDSEDSLPLDDQAWAALPVPTVSVVRVEGVQSPFLSALIRSIPDLTETDDPQAPPELSVINRGDPGEIDRPSWLIRTDPPPPGLRLTGLATNLGVTWQRPGEPVLDDVSLAGTAVAEAQVVATDLWLPVVRSGDVPLVLLGRVNGHRAVYFTFDMAHSNLVVQMAFPLLGAKLLEWLGGEAAGGIHPSPAGVPIPLLASGTGMVRVESPDGETVTLGANVTSFGDSGTPGVYRVQYLNADEQVGRSELAIRNFSPSESAARPRSIAVEPGSFISDQRSETIREWGLWVAALAASLMILEWWLALRRPKASRRPTAGSMMPWVTPSGRRRA
ncbi:MAG: VWA domain-containing protein [bacterium]|nr:VWA domain-containing protein [Acidimicrobiia bacterium]MCY4651328.1 VWA domain-containing protein [bacterium]